MSEAEVIIDKSQGDAVGTIDDLISYLQDAKDQGATHYRMDWAKDQEWAFKSFTAFREKTLNEIVAERRAKYEEAIEQLNQYTDAGN